MAVAQELVGILPKTNPLDLLALVAIALLLILIEIRVFAMGQELHLLSGVVNVLTHVEIERLAVNLGERLYPTGRILLPKLDVASNVQYPQKHDAFEMAILLQLILTKA